MQPDLSAVPSDLKRWDQWVVWRYLDRGGKKTKPPYCPATGALASVDDPRTWGTFEAATRALESGQYAGVSYILMRWDPFCGIDLDHVVEDGKIAPWARAIVDHFASYTECSPSGAGLHIWIRAKLPGERRRNEQVELYDERRSLTVTGAHLEGTPNRIEARQEELERFYWHLFPPEAKRQISPHQPQTPADLSDADLLTRALGARNGHRFARLWSGDTRDYNEDKSRADLALCGMLAYWTNGDAERTDRLFRQSGLMRDKWDQRHYGSGETYGQRTIARALAGFGGVRIKVHTT